MTLVEMMIVVGIVAVISAILISVNTQTYGASSANTSEQIVSALNLCKMRAVSTRRWHRCQINPNSITTMEWQNVGMAVPGVGVWTVVSTQVIGAGVEIWDGTRTVCIATPCSGAPTTANPGLLFDVDFRPDGSSNGGTIYVTNRGHNKSSRVVVYRATGSSYARNTW